MRKKLSAKQRKDAEDDDDDKAAAKNGSAASKIGEDVFKSTKEYPAEVPFNELYVDADKEVVFVPINGAPVPFHISMIKSVVQPEADKSASYVRLNFYAPGQSLGKDAPPSVARLVDEHKRRSVFVKEMLYRSREQRHLNAAFRAIQELRKRYRQSLAKAAEEADLVAQETLIKTRDQRVPRMTDLTMKPFMSGKKSVGTLEAHANGLRFVSKKQEILDIMYKNIKHALFQPCEQEVVVLIHFHLKHPIMIGKKKSHDVQFQTEVVDASVQLDAGRRSMYDPDELDEEQKERTLRKKLNEMFKEFCKRVERVAKAYDVDLEFDIPYRDLGFHGVPHREMVLIQPTVHCLVALIETPFFVVELEAVEHVHFERCTLRASNFDMVIINKNFDVAPVQINMVPMAELEAIQEWLTDCSITYTAGQASLSWGNIMNLVKSDAHFYEDTDENGEDKPAGWSFLQADDSDDEGDDGEDGDEDYNQDEEEDEDDEDDDDDDDDDDDFDEVRRGLNVDVVLWCRVCVASSQDDDDDDDEDGDDDDEEEGMDWEEMEQQAEADDRKTRDDEHSPRKKQRR
mmetsp:Transcript_15989/g.64504  ORF Transcript_15989/g.64504 Transcript_15989/m.64504 type:complete len:571 (+) Transcript_15989:474-2186(+)